MKTRVELIVLIVRWFGFMALLLAGSGCGSEVGDACRDNLDCSQLGERICDLSQPEGYCTVQGCNAESCPDNAACVAFYPIYFLSRQCDPATEDAVDPSIVPTDDCLPQERCLPEGVCARRALEQRFCMKACRDDDDCRPGYECSQSGSRGAEAVVEPKDAAKRQSMRYCSRRPADD